MKRPEQFNDYIGTVNSQAYPSDQPISHAGAILIHSTVTAANYAGLVLACAFDTEAYSIVSSSKGGLLVRWQCDHDHCLGGGIDLNGDIGIFYNLVSKGSDAIGQIVGLRS